MKSPTLLFAICLLSLCFVACNGSSNDDCDPTRYCETIQPSTGLLMADLTINNENPYLPITVYQGNADDSLVYLVDTVSSSSVSYSLPISQRYSMVVKYQLQGRTLLAVDGGKIKLDSDSNCGETCYSSKDLHLDMRLAR